MKKIRFQHILYLLLIGAFVYFVVHNRGQLIETAQVFRQGVWYLLLIVLVLLGLVVYNQATLYSSIYRIFALPDSKRRLASLYLVMRFVSVAAPSGGVSGWVPFIQDARRRNLGVGAVMVANLMYTILWYSAFAIFLLVGMISLFLAHDLQWFEISAAIVLVVVDSLMIMLLVLAGVAPNALHAVLDYVRRVLARITGWLKRPALLQSPKIANFINNLNEAAVQIHAVGWKAMVRPVGHALLNEALNMSMFYLCARAFGLIPSFGLLVAAYSISVLFFIISPTPGGLGFVEGALLVVLKSLGVPAAKATVVTLAYRGVTFWLPFILGFFALRWFHRYPVQEIVEAK